MGNILSSLFGGKKDKKVKEMQVTSAEDLKEKYSGFDFQWIKGENLSMVEKYKSISTNGDFTFIDFQSGNKINVDLIEEYMVTFPASVVDFTKNENPTQIHKPKLNSDSSVTSIVYEESGQSHHDSPIYKLLRKQKKNMVEVSIKIKLNLPPKDLYGVLLSSFDEAEKEIIQFILDGVDIENIKNSLADSIKKEYYTSSSSKKETTVTKKKQNDKQLGNE